MTYRKRYFHKFVDKIMEDGKIRSSATIIEILKDSMIGKDIYGRHRAGYYLPDQRKLSYYLRINKQYLHLNKDTRNSSWQKVN